MKPFTLRNDTVLYFFLGALFTLCPIIEYVFFGFVKGPNKDFTFPLITLLNGFTLFLCLFFKLSLSLFFIMAYIAWVAFVFIGSFTDALTISVVTILNAILLFSAAGFKDKKQLYPFLWGLVAMFFCISVLLQLHKIYQSGLSFEQVRSGLNIYGSGFFVNVALIAASIMSVDKYTQAKYQYLILSMCLIHSLLFLNRSGVIFIGLAFLVLIVVINENSIRKRLKGLLIVSVVGVFLGLATEVFSALGSRFGFAEFDSVNGYLQYMIQLQFQEGQRLHEWSVALKLLSEHPVLGLGYGKYIQFGNYSNAHNLILNTLCEAGIILGGIILISLLAIPIILGFNNPRFVVIFLTFILYSNVSGVALSQTHLLQTNVIVYLLFILLVRVTRENSIRRYLDSRVTFR